MNMDEFIFTEIKEREEKLRQAMLNSDVNSLDELLSSDLVFTNHLDQIMTKEDDISAHKSGDLNIKKIELFEQKIKALGELGIVTVLARIQGSFKGESSEGAFRFTRVWSRGPNNSWKLIVGHSCAVR